MGIKLVAVILLSLKKHNSYSKSVPVVLHCDPASGEASHFSARGARLTSRQSAIPHQRAKISGIYYIARKCGLLNCILLKPLSQSIHGFGTQVILSKTLHYLTGTKQSCMQGGLRDSLEQYC